MSVNKVILIGNLGDNVKMHYFEGGSCVGNVPLATSYNYTNRTTGEKVSETEWHNLVFSNKAAEVIEKFTKKGDKLYVEGRIKTRKWKNDKGEDRYSQEIKVSAFTFLNNKKESEGTSSSSAAQSSTTSPQSEQMPQPPGSDNDDLPF